MRLEVDIVSKSFTNAAGKRQEVLAHVEFSLYSGEVGVVVGPSGCGKSTMLRILAGLDSDFEGHVTRPEAARLAMVFQEPRLLPWRSVEQNVRLAAPDIDAAKLDAILSVLELSGHREHYPGELSLGLARRVAIARAFAVEPDFLILDEPLASLDEALASRLREEIATLVGSRPMITLLVTHSLEDAVRLGDRLFFLSARPARLLHAVPIQTPRAARTDEVITATKADLARLDLAGQ